ncbi:MAG: hypothetical protein ABI782_10875, partial [Anaerolineaceae bacterium]
PADTTLGLWRTFKTGKTPKNCPKSRRPRLIRMEDPEIIQEFLTESRENLSLPDQELIELEQRPDSPDLIANSFRTIHTNRGYLRLPGLRCHGGDH